MLPVEQPYKIYTGLDGRPLQNGYVYFGQPDQNPITNPVTVYWDADGLIPAAQPLRTSNGYIMRGGTPANVYFTGNYSILVQNAGRVQVFYARNSLDFSIATLVNNTIGLIGGPNGAGQVGYSNGSPGSVAGTVADHLREYVSLANFGVIGDGTDESAKMQDAIDAAAGKTLLGDASKTYVFQNTLNIPSNTVLDFQGATVIDDVRGYWPASDAGRAEPLFFIYGVSDVTLRNFRYQATASRATVGDEVPTGIIWIGDNRGGVEPTSRIRVENIEASNCADATLFVSILGNAFDIDVRRVAISGNCSYGINIEYGQAPTGTSDEAAYGLHPYNINVEQFNGYDNNTSVGFLRVASCYNIKFTNCYGKDVRFFIYAWTGDRSISRVSENVVFENCSSYASSTFMPGAVDYSVQILSANKDGSTGEPLPSWTNYNHLFTFNNCQFQNNKVENSALVRFYGQQGSTVFNSCIFRNSYFGVRAEPSSNPNYTSVSSLTFNECMFLNNSRDVLLTQINGVLFNRCKFKDGDGALVPVKVTTGSSYNRFIDCIFFGLKANRSYVVIDPGCVYNEISECQFDNVGGAASLDIGAVTHGMRNLAPQELTRVGPAYYGLQQQPESMTSDLSEVSGTQLDADRSNIYQCPAGARTITGIKNGRIGDEVTLVAISSGASLNFTFNASGESTTSRIITPTSTDFPVAAGSYWTVRLRSTPIGWILAN